MGKNRTYLFAPGSNQERVVKALNSQADAVIMDLEDAVAISEKAAARITVRNLLDLPRKGRAFVRVNSFRTSYTEKDLEAVVTGNLDGIVLPKTESAADVIGADRLINYFEQNLGLDIGKTEIMPLVETAKGVWNIEKILTQSPRVKKVAFGSGDFTLDIGVEWSKDGKEIFYARSRLVLASRAVGAEPPIDTVFPHVRDAEGLVSDATVGRRLGFQGKLIIHPSQIVAVNEIYSPTAEQITFAKQVIEAFNEAEKKGIAAIVVGGKLIDYPVVDMAKKVLANAN